MPSPVNAITGISGDRSPTSADVLAEAQQRRIDRLRAAQAANVKPTDVVEKTAKSESAPATVAKEGQLRYRVNLDSTTGRLTTELLDSETGEVILRVPPTYVDPADVLPHPARNALAPQDEDARS